MERSELLRLVEKLRDLSAETEIVEFKEAKRNFDFSSLGEYFSALCNEANLKNRKFAWLVFGIEDKHHTIVGSNYRPLRKDLDWILKSIKEHGSMNRKDIDKLLWNILPAWMNEEQKKNRTMNLIQELSKKGKIVNKGTRFSPEWNLS